MPILLGLKCNNILNTIGQHSTRVGQWSRVSMPVMSSGNLCEHGGTSPADICRAHTARRGQGGLEDHPGRLRGGGREAAL